MTSFPEIRRQDRLLASEQIEFLLNTGEYGVLSMCAANGYGYGVPLSFARDGEKLYFHCSPEGFKLQNLAANNQASFCIVGRTQVLPEKFSTGYESVIVFGKVTRQLPDDERQAALRLLIRKYCHSQVTSGEKYIESAFHRTQVLRLDIEHRSGKSRKFEP
jgi:nitroimidazol reductase NimA-like FMN-containing flavoprotein (pyridoxamine 5'-phosphate oxidase superfamily)